MPWRQWLSWFYSLLALQNQEHCWTDSRYSVKVKKWKLMNRGSFELKPCFKGIYERVSKVTVIITRMIIYSSQNILHLILLTLLCRFYYNPPPLCKGENLSWENGTIRTETLDFWPQILGFLGCTEPFQCLALNVIVRWESSSPSAERTQLCFQNEHLKDLIIKWENNNNNNNNNDSLNNIKRNTQDTVSRTQFSFLKIEEKQQDL